MNIEAFYPVFLESKNVTIDSRTVEAGSIFFAFSGENYNAAKSAKEAIRNGAIAVIVEDRNYEDKENRIYYTESTLQFLQQLAKFHRERLNIPIIALTGSNGKTTTKELISAVLSRKFNVQFTKGNLNNHIGVPLTLLSVRADHEIAVVEMGANHQKEIEALAEIAAPDLGYITNFGKAHLEGFGGVEGVIKGKSELYAYLKENGKKILVNDLDPVQVEKTSDYSDIISFGTSDSNFFFESLTEGNHVGIRYHNEIALSQLTGSYNFTNLSAAAALGLHFGIPFSEIKTAIEAYTPTNMRSQIVKKGEKTLVLDTYNANPSSMAVALENFKTFEGSKTVILGDMLELGEESYKEHQKIFALAQGLGFEQIILVGKNFAEISKDAFTTAADLSRYLQTTPVTSKNILLKGSRGITLEKVIEFL